MTDEDPLVQLTSDLNEAHTLIEIARRTLWSAEGDPEMLDEPSSRIRRVLEHLDQAHDALDGVIDEVESERSSGSAPDARPPGTIIH